MQEELLTKLTDATRQLIRRRKLGAISVPIVLQVSFHKCEIEHALAAVAKST